MLAKPIEDVANVAAPEEWVVEDKYDGIRAQIHRQDGRVRIFTRGMEDTTAAFPEIVDAMALLPGTAVFDGEILAWREGRALAFGALQQRIARKKVSANLRDDVPVVFMGYDLLYRGRELLLDQPLEARRAALEEELAGAGPLLLLSPQIPIASHDELDRLFEEARTRGNEGLILKRRGSVYEAGRRSGTWCKVKRAFATLDVVVTAAEQGHGKRATVLSDYTFAVRDGDRLVNIGKAYSGLTDEEIRNSRGCSGPSRSKSSGRCS
jgi:DNA ligase-1